MTRKTKALKPYLEAIEKYCSGLTKKELLETILSIAKRVPQAKRVDFLERFTQNNDNVAIDTPTQENLIQEIRDLREEVEERVESIEDGSYYEEYPDEYYDEYSEEPPEYLLEEQKEALEALFQQTETLFLSNQLEAAKAAFDELFEFELEDLYLGIDLRETQARYCRCVYEIYSPEQRVNSLLAAITPSKSFQLSQSLFDGKYPFLQDVIDAGSGYLPDFDKFLPEWEHALAKIDTKRARLLGLEATEFMHGLDGVATLAQKWSKEQPLGYLFWIEKLIEKKAWAKVASVTQEALEVLPHSDYRASIADSLIFAGKNQDDLLLMLKGKKEKFFSRPDDSTLLHWINEAREERTEALKQASKFLSKKKQLSNLYIKVSLMAGEIDKAFVRVNKVKAFGWSGDQNPAGIVFAAILIALLPRKQQATPLHQAILEYYSRSYSFETVPEEKGNSMIAQIIQGLRGRQWPASQRSLWLEWAENIGKQRVEHIVSNKYRKAYQRAAEILGALAEYFILSGKQDYGVSIVIHYRDVQFNHYPAFRREVDSVVKNSTCLRDKGIA